MAKQHKNGMRKAGVVHELWMLWGVVELALHNVSTGSSKRHTASCCHSNSHGACCRCSCCRWVGGEQGWAGGVPASLPQGGCLLGSRSGVLAGLLTRGGSLTCLLGSRSGAGA